MTLTANPANPEKLKAQVVYTDNSIVDIIDYDYENTDKLGEALLISFKQNNGLVSVGDEYSRLLINFAHVKQIKIEKCE